MILVINILMCVIVVISDTLLMKYITDLWKSHLLRCSTFQQAFDDGAKIILVLGILADKEITIIMNE